MSDPKELNDSLDDLIGSPVTGPRISPRLPADYKPAVERAFTEPCGKCGGSGNWRPGYPCFACKGTGKKTFKTSKADRAANRERAAVKRVERVRDKAAEIAAWTAAHDAEIKWLRAAANRNADRNGNFNFPIEMINAVNKFGSLTDGQLAAVRKLMLRDVERSEQRKAAAPEIDVSKIEQAFAKARASAARPGMQGVWVKPLKLRAGDTDMSFQPGSAGSQWDGMIFVRADSRKIGYIKGGKFFRKFECTDVDQAAVLAAAADPSTAAVAYGKAWGRCAVCSRTLTNDGSIERGIGPICAERFGF